MLKIRIVLAKMFRALFKINFIKSKYFGLHKRVFKPLNLFKGVVLNVKFNDLYLVLHIDDWIQHIIYFLGEYEKAELKTLDYFLKDKSVFVDLGANFGLFSLYAARLIGSEGRVYSFEPFKKNYESLNANITINKIKNIQVENIAVGEKDGSLDLYYDASEMNLGMVSTKIIENSYCEKVNVITLDSYFMNNILDRVDFIKIDIEGHEYKVLRGMEKILLTHHPTILIEILNEDELSKNENEIDKYLSNFGYKKYFINDNGSISIKQNNASRENYIFSTKNNLRILV